MSKAFSGSRGSIKLNGVKVAFVADINIEHSNTLERLNVLDQIESGELAEVGHECSFTISKFMIDNNNAADFGLDPEDPNDLLTQPSLTMDLYDKINDEARYTMSGVKFEGGSGSMEARGVWRGSWRFQGIVGRGI